ncbi:hypothetical protein pesp101 [Peridroma alphabaculovirus]|uniref:Uncharacterized protein n=1 Tax=Peridroma alphabaculovirus TaxID=1346829 RepID=A0A068LKK3_9ABAC|nr:hypothetical protein pesp101 [Peridroma alphabaculovirus]AIE47827.1 hypothetical protein pesp101 [Peridroma alphabaculovirus]
MSCEMFIYSVVRRASCDVDAAHQRALFNHIENHQRRRRRRLCDVRALLDSILLKFDVNAVYVLVENIKAIVWALVRLVYARNPNLLTSRRHERYLSYAHNLAKRVSRPLELHEYARNLYRRFSVYELREDSLDWDELMDMMCTLATMFSSETSERIKNNNVVKCNNYNKTVRCSKVCKPDKPQKINVL